MYSQVGFLWQSNGTCVTDCFYSLQYQSYFVSHVPKAQFASFHLQCLCCHQKPAVCKYTSLAPLYRQMGYWWRFYGLQYVVTLCCQIGGTAGSLVIRSHSACCVCVMALMYLFMSLAYNYAAECSIARLLSSGGLPCAMMQVLLCWKGTSTMLWSTLACGDPLQLTGKGKGMSRSTGLSLSCRR